MYYQTPKSLPGKVVPKTKLEADQTTDNSYSLNEYVMLPAITFTIPVLVRLFQLVKDTANSEDGMHLILEKLIELGMSQDIISMKDYADIVASITAPTAAPPRPHNHKDTM